MRKPIGVKQLTNYLSSTFREDPILQNIIVEGEVANLRISKFIYFDLKEDNVLVNCVIFSNDFEIEDGQKIIVKGSVSLYSGSSKYQINVKDIVVSGLGLSFIEIEKLKIKLEKKGYFLEIYKKSISEFPLDIGIITSSQSAAIKDFFKVLSDENYFGKVYFYDSLVQGGDAVKTIVDGIKRLDKLDLDAIVITRGGGSNEDLSVFNSEIIADSIFNSTTPIISAIGHERDFTISDLVSDIRLSTPTKAAEFITKNFRHAKTLIEDVKKNNSFIIRKLIEKGLNYLEIIKLQIENNSPQTKIENKLKKIDLIRLSNQRNFENFINKKIDLINDIRQSVENRYIKFVEENQFYVKDFKNNLVDGNHLIENQEYIIENRKSKYKILVLEKVNDKKF
ncbi:MAG: exodeoxyribonuclease VII large subunit [Tissierellia bacterium]|nr:exodeoxyribonuclease VII large subunit [Tissierellia bacterium]